MRFLSRSHLFYKHHVAESKFLYPAHKFIPTLHRFENKPSKSL